MKLEELGGIIRAKREETGLSLDDVAARIKISKRILLAIEEGNHSALPHAVYSKSFARSYGQVVGCDQEELNAALERVFPPEMLDDSKVESVLTKNASESYPGTVRRVVAMLVLLAILGGVGGGIWFIYVNYGNQIVELVKQPFSAKNSEEAEPPALPQGNGTNVSAVDDAFRVLMPGTQGVSAPPPLPDNSGYGMSDAAAFATSATTTPAPAGVDASAPGAAPQLPVAQGEGTPQAQNGEDARPLETQTEQTPASPVLFVPGGKNQLQISASEPCWISSRADGARGRDFTLKAGESFVLTYKDNLEITFGNAGGVLLEHNSVSLGKPGARGQRAVVRYPADLP